MQQAAADILTQIESEATTKKVAETRVFKSFPVGSVIRQGDIYIVAVDPTTHAHGALVKDRQLAQGSTQGSRHVAEHPSQVFEGTTRPKVINRKTGKLVDINDRAFLGPMVQSDVEFRISHPQHSDVIIPAGACQIIHQMDARTLQRVKD